MTQLTSQSVAHRAVAYRHRYGLVFHSMNEHRRYATSFARDRLPSIPTISEPKETTYV